MRSTIPLIADVYVVCLQSALLSVYAVSLAHASYLTEDTLQQAQQLHLLCITAVSYTHLDVYKRQVQNEVI